MPTYRYLSENDAEYDDANDDYTLVMVMGDQFDMYRHGNVYVVQHEDSPEINFKLTLKEGNSLLKLSEERLTVRPDPNNPPYLLFEPHFDMIKPLYDYYNKLYFNNACPVVKFRKTSSTKVWGLAKLEWYKGRPLFTMLVNESTMIDRKLFTNTIIHEMIHLYNFATGAALHLKAWKTPEEAQEALERIHDNHGPRFQAEMHRINAHGFRIIMAGTHEEVTHKATEHFYAIVAERVASGTSNLRWSAWYTHEQLDRDDLQKFADALKTHAPHEAMRIKLVKTTNREITYGTHLKSTKSITKPSLDKINNSKLPDGLEEIDEISLFASLAVQLPDYRDIPETYALPFSRFTVAMKRYTEDRQALKAKWMGFPVKLLNKEIEEKLKSLIGLVRRKSIKEADLMNHIQDMRDTYDERTKYAVYNTTMRKLLDTWDKNGVMVPYYRFLGLED